MRSSKKILSILLMTTVFATALPTMVKADDSKPAITNTEGTSQAAKQEEAVPKIVGEINDKRDENIKQFLMDDNSYEAVIYNEPVHYYEDGQWKDIDNTLQDAEDDELASDTDNSDEGDNSKTSLKAEGAQSSSKQGDKNALTNTSNSFKVSFSKNTKKKKLVTLKKDKYEISWGLDNSNKAASSKILEKDSKKLEESIQAEADKKISSDKKISTLSADKKAKAKENIMDNSEKETVEKNSSSVQYSNIYTDTDLRYDLIGDKVKENIVINKPQQNVSYSFNLNAKNLTPQLQKDNSIIFYDDKDSKKAVFQMQAPNMYDAKESQSDAVKVSLDKTKNGYRLTVTPDSDWLNSSDRVYPVTIDPPVETNIDRAKIQDTFVSSIDTENKANNILLYAGFYNNLGIHRSYVKFDLPQLSSSDMVINAQLSLACDSLYNGGGQVNVHKVLSDWNTTNITWANQPGYNSRIEDYNTPVAGQWSDFDITSIAKEWYNSGNNFGLMLKADNENSGDAAFRSADTTDANARPRAYIDYVSNTGLENYWTYHAQDVGRTGTAYVNDYNGNLVFVHDDLDMTGNKMPISIKHVYNSNYAVQGIKDGARGVGWRLNLDQTITTASFEDGQYYIYMDEDGTKHYFKVDASGTQKDSEGLDLTLIKNSDGSYVIKDKKNNQLIFDNSGKLTNMLDTNNNAMTLIYTNGRLTSVKDGVGREVKIDYNVNGQMNKITDPSGRSTVYGFDGDKLSYIAYSDGNTSYLSYDSNNCLTAAKNYDGYTLNLNYSQSYVKRLTKLQEVGTDGSLGEELNITYGYNTTNFTDSKGNKSMYQFDDLGKTVSIRDNDGSAEYYKYSDGNNISKATDESKLQKTVINLMSNGNMEYDGDRYAASGGGSGTSGYSTDTSYIGNRSYKVTKTDNISSQFGQQNICLDKGKTYTFSAYVKTKGISNTSGQGAFIIVHYKNKDGLYQDARSDYLNGTNDWTRLQVTFTLPSDASDNLVITRLSLGGETGTAYYDAVQLEEGKIANRYNILDNADFSGGGQIPDGWKAHDTEASDGLVDTADADHPTALNKKVFKLTGGSQKDAKISYEAAVNGKAGDTFVVSGWGKGASVSKGDFAIYVYLLAVQGSDQLEVIRFNRDCDNWQYISGVIKAKQDYKRIDVYTIYKNNANTAYFDGIQLFKEEFGESYEYDSKGNIISTSDLAKQQSKFEYNANNDLVKATDPKGNQFQYEYDGKHNLDKATSAENVVYSFTYDSSGNQLTSKVGDGFTFINASASYTDDGNYIKSVTDSSGNTVSYNYDQTKGTLTSQTDAKQNTTNYTYDSMDRLQTVTKASGGQNISNSYSYSNDKISSILSNNGQVKYNFGYDAFGNNTTVSVGNQNLITNTYEARTHKFLQATYGNGHIIGSIYDIFDRLIGKTFNGNTLFTYDYDANNNLAVKSDKVNGVDYKYIYDTSNRLVAIEDSKGNKLKYGFDSNSNVSSVWDYVNGKGSITGYAYDKDNRATETSYNRGNLSNSQSEYFPLNGVTAGTNGTKPTTENAKFGLNNTVNRNIEITYFNVVNADSDSSPDTLVKGKDYRMRVVVKNSGGTAMSPTTITFKKNSQWFQDINTDTINPGDSRTYYSSFKADTTGIYSFSCTADSHDTALEANNNKANLVYKNVIDPASNTSAIDKLPQVSVGNDSLITNGIINLNAGYKNTAKRRYTWSNSQGQPNDSDYGDWKNMDNIPSNLLNGQTFNGTSDYTNIGSINYDYSKGFSITFDARWDALNNWSRIIDFGNGENKENLVIANSGTTNSLYVGMHNGDAQYYMTIPNVITIGEMASWRVYFDPKGYCTVYKNNNLVGQSQLSLPNNLARTNCYVARSNWAADSYFKGEIDKLAITTNASNAEWKNFDGNTYNLMTSKTFNGSSDYTNVGNTNYDYSKGFTISFDARWDALNNWSRILDFGNGEYKDNILVSNQASTNTLHIGSYDGSKEYGLNIPNAIDLGQMTSWKINFNSNGYCTVYKNGSIIGQGQLVIPASVARANSYIGRSNWAADSYFKGEIDNLNLTTYTAVNGFDYSFNVPTKNTFNGNNDYLDVGKSYYDFSNGMSITFDAKWNSLNNWSRIIDFGNGPTNDNIVIENEGTTNNLCVGAYNGSTAASVTIPNIITVGEMASWKIDIDAGGYCKVYKNNNIVGEKQLVVPRNIVRNNCYVGKSNCSGDAYFNGEIYNLNLRTDSTVDLLSGKSYDGSSGAYTDLGTTNLNLQNGFTASFTAKWDALNFCTRILDFGNGQASDNIVIYNSGTTNTLDMDIYQGSKQYSILIPNAIQIGEIANWKFDVDNTGYCNVYKNNRLIGKGQLAIPNNVLRKNSYIAKSNWSADSMLQGKIYDLKITGKDSPVINENITQSALGNWYLHMQTQNENGDIVNNVFGPYNNAGMTSVNSDEKGKTTLLADDGTKLIYDLGINKNAGTMTAWFDSTTNGGNRTILSSAGSNGEMLNLYLGSDNKVRLAVKNAAGSQVDLITTEEAAGINQWNFAGASWNVIGNILSVALNLNGKSYTASTSDFKDFTNAATAVGTLNDGTSPLKGYMEQFAYSSQYLDSTAINNIYNGGRGSSKKNSYDSLGRISSSAIYTGNSLFSVLYNYAPGANGSTTTKLSSIVNNGSSISYSYDANGNIVSIVQNGKTIGYSYNELNELIREDNGVLNKSITYSYDAGGNIQTKTEYAYTTGSLGTATATHNYTYGNSNWKDELTAYDGNAITYDAIGNPLTYAGYSYSWEQGRQLSGITGNGLTASYKYDDSGIRTQKTVNGVITNYHLVGSDVTYEDNGTDKIYYTYDSAGKLVSMNLNGVEYYYIRNGQSDIIGLFDKTGATVASYTYDTWGKLISIKDGSGADITNNTTSVGYKNPYRYRGYRYDTETGLYYLQSRYYNPDWGRFINADAIAGSVGELLGHNLFAYCKNNPVNGYDADGFRMVMDPDSSVGVYNYNNWAAQQARIAAAQKNSKSSNGFNYNQSVREAMESGTGDKIAEKIAGVTIKSKTTWQSAGTLAIGKYMTKISPAAKVIGTAGSLGFGTYHVIDSISNKQYFGALVDATSTGAGIYVGGQIAAGGTFIIATFGLVGAPALLVGGGVFVVSVGAGVLIDRTASAIKDWYYGR